MEAAGMLFILAGLTCAISGGLDWHRQADPGRIVGGAVAAIVGLLLYFHGYLNNQRKQTHEAVQDALRKVDRRLKKLEAGLGLADPGPDREEEEGD